jgi:phage terminase large subunit GpA-like protein
MKVDLSFVDARVRRQMWRYLMGRVDLLPSEIPTLSVSEYAERRRVLPTGTPFPGPWSNRRTPYLIEIMDNMSVMSPIQHTTIMKGAQLGFTAAAENAIVYWIDAVPAEILFLSATEPSAKTWAEKRIEPAIDSCGIRHKIFAQSKAKGTRRQGDRTMKKEFIGGGLDIASAQSAASLRSQSKRILIRDEIDGAPAQLRTGEGNWLDVSFARTFAFDDRKKVLDLSTPTTMQASEIYKQFLLGDQRKFFVACPHCGGFQILEWGSPRGNHGMRGETTAGQLTDVYYQCEHCHEPIRDHQKQLLLETGYWEPTTASSSPYTRSYHLSSLYSPLGMLAWWTMWVAYAQAVEDPEKMRAFTNLYLGNPYRETGEKPKLENIIELKDGYRRGTIPSDEVLFLTCGVDVQRGSEKDTNNPPRLELEICGHGAGFKTWSIEYAVIEGAIGDPYAGAWAAFNEKVSELFFYTKPNGKTLQVSLVLIDSGDGSYTPVVYEFCGRWQNTFPSKGTQVLKKKNIEKFGDVVDNMNFLRYKSNTVGGSKIFTISTNYYKNHIYSNINNTYRHLDDKTNRNGVCFFPFDYSDGYFSMLTAEERRADGSFHCPNGKRNEALDIRVMNLAAADIFLDAKVKTLRDNLRAAKASAEQVEKINVRHILEIMGKTA